MTSVGRLALRAALLALAACGDSRLAPSTKIAGPRVLAITTAPSVLPLDGDLALTVLTVDPDGPRIDGRPVDAMRMRACAPWKFITDPARDCAAADALPLTVDAAGRVVTTAAELAAAFPSPPGVPAPPDPWRAALAAGLKLRVPIIAEVEVDGQTLVERRDVDVVETTVQRQNPRLDEIRFDGSSIRTLRAGQRYALTATIAPASLDEGPDAEPSGARENVVCNFYSPTGELGEPEASLDDPAALVPETTPNTYTAGPPGTTWLFVIATDETGGMSAASVPLTIE
jgi:hypothetical protein